MPGEDSGGVTDGVRETAEDVVREADRGRSERAPFITLGGVMLVVGIAVGVLVLIVGLVYALS